MVFDLFLCGGTIDKTYFSDRESFDFDKTHTDTMIKRARMTDIDFNIKSICMKDSRDMDKKDDQRLARAINESLANKILVMGGLNKMIETAEKVAEELNGAKTVVFFGSVVPYEVKDTDALFNFGASVIGAQLLDPGVYICIGGKITPYYEVGEIQKRGHFKQGW
jgi:L-asparaginase